MRSHRSTIVGLLFLTIIVITLPLLIIFTRFRQEIKAHTDTTSVPWLKTIGNKIVTANTNQAVILHGANVMRSEWVGSMAWENQSIPILAQQWNGNVMLRGFASDPVIANDAHYLNLLDQNVTLAQTYRLYIIFAWRSYTINGPQPTMPNVQAQQALTILAARYRGIPNVIYALQVEPHNVTWATLRPIYETMIDSIRQAAAPYVPLIMVPGTNWSADVSGAITDPVKRPNIVYKSHPYAPSSQFQSLFGNTYDAGLPVFIGEFAPDGTRMNINDVRALLAFTRQRDIGWAPWIWDYESIPLLNQDFTPTNPFGTTIQREMVRTPPLPSDESRTIQPILAIRINYLEEYCVCYFKRKKILLETDGLVSFKG